MALYAFELIYFDVIHRSVFKTNTPIESFCKAIGSEFRKA